MLSLPSRTGATKDVSSFAEDVEGLSGVTIGFCGTGVAVHGADTAGAAANAR